MKATLLCAILAALCGPACAQYTDPYIQRNYESDERMWDNVNRDYERDQLQQQMRDLEQQRNDAQRQLDAERYRSMMNDVDNNFGCDIHNHCR